MLAFENILLGESKYVEYKVEYSKNLLKTVSAFANYADGHIVIGISDDNSIIGLENIATVKLRIENAINDALEPIPLYEIHSKNIGDKVVLVLKVYKGDYTPYTYNNKAYKRMDTSTIPVDKYSYEELIMQGRNITYDQLPCEVQELDFFELEKRLKKVLKLGAVTKDVMITLNLYANGNYNNAAGLLADNNPLDNSAVQLLAFTTDSVLEIKDRMPLAKMSVLEQYDRSLDFYRKHINSADIINSAYRVTVEEVPFIAYREALANAIVHRDYARAGDIRIEFYSDRIEITSPGGLPIGITEEEYINGRISVPRNKILTDVFFRLGIIEKLATGIRRIREYYRGYSQTPILSVSENTIQIILPKVNQASNINDKKAEYMVNLLQSNEKIVYDYIKKHGTINRKQTEELIGMKKTQAAKILKTLYENNYIIKLGSGRNVRYKVKT